VILCVCVVWADSVCVYLVSVYKCVVCVCVEFLGVKFVCV